MKRLSMYALFLMLSTFSACEQKSEGNENDDAKGGVSKEMFESNRAVMRAIETGDSITLRKYITADAVDHGAGEKGEDLKGDAIIRQLTDIHNHIDGLKMEVIEEAANDDHIFTLVRLTGTTNKPYWGMPAGFKMDSKSVDVVKVKDGKMTDHWGYYDMAEMMAMMNGGQGAPPPPPPPVQDTTKK